MAAVLEGDILALDKLAAGALKHSLAADDLLAIGAHCLVGVRAIWRKCSPAAQEAASLASVTWLQTLADAGPSVNRTSG